METPWCCSPSLSLKGQGYLILCLTFPCLWSLGSGTPEPSLPILPSSTLWTTASPTSPPQSPQPPSAIPNVTSPSHSPVSDPPPTANVQEGISPTSVSRWKDSTSSTHGGVVEGDGGLFSSQTSVFVSSGRGASQDSMFLSPSVLSHRTRATTSVGVGVSVGTGGWESTTLADSAVSVSSSVFVDSVASSVRSNPSGALASHGQASSHSDFATTTSPLPKSGSDYVLSMSSEQHLSSLKDAVFQTSGGVVTSSTVTFSGASSVMLDMNTTQSSAIFQPGSGETTSAFLSSTPEVSSPGSAGGNGSCAETETGCVEYQRDEEEEEEERRIKIIIGAVCGAILLVVILGVFIGCVLKRRGKMPSGSKIDLSSYWDDSVTLSYINGHVDIPKDSADEMISLDNDSFLNSLDSMSFTNTWTSDTSKHTNF